MLVTHLEPLARLAASDHVPALISQDLKEPGSERTGDVEPVERFPGLDEGVLERVPCFVDAAEHANGKSESRALVGPHQRLVRSGVSRLGHSDHFAFDLRLQRFSLLVVNGTKASEESFMWIRQADPPIMKDPPILVDSTAHTDGVTSSGEKALARSPRSLPPCCSSAVKSGAPGPRLSRQSRKSPNLVPYGTYECPPS